MAIQYICFKEGTPIGRRRQKKRFKPDIHPVVDVDGIVPHRVTSYWNLLLTGRGYDRLSAEAMTVVRVAVGKLPPPQSRTLAFLRRGYRRCVAMSLPPLPLTVPLPMLPSQRGGSDQEEVRRGSRESPGSGLVWF